MHAAPNNLLHKLQAARLEKQHSWIVEEKHHFGQTGTAYDFTDYSIEKGQKELEDRTNRKHALERSINAKAMNMLGTAEEQVILNFLGESLKIALVRSGWSFNKINGWVIKGWKL